MIVPAPYLQRWTRSIFLLTNQMKIMNTPNSNKSNWGILAAIGAGVVASACCIVPLLLVTLGVGGAWVSNFSALEPFRPYFITVALGFLAYAGYREYRTAKGPECDCEVSMKDHLRRTLLVLGLIITLGFIASPWIIKGTDSNAANTRALFAQNGDIQEVVLRVEGMSCETCPITVKTALSRLEGVEEVHVTYDPPQAVVRFDPSRVSVEDLEQATTNAGYPSSMVNP